MLTSVNNLGLVLLDQRQHKVAEELFLQALAGRKRVIGDDHLDTLSSILDVATII